MSSQPKKQRRGITLVDILIVVVVLGIVAAAVVPEYTPPVEAAASPVHSH